MLNFILFTVVSCCGGVGPAYKTLVKARLTYGGGGSLLVSEKKG